MFALFWVWVKIIILMWCWGTGTPVSPLYSTVDGGLSPGKTLLGTLVELGLKSWEDSTGDSSGVRTLVVGRL